MPLSALKPRSNSAIVRNMLKEIEAAFSVGASREDVWKTLRNEEGLSCNFASFAKALLRARQGDNGISSGPLRKGKGTIAVSTSPASRLDRKSGVFDEPNSSGESETNNKTELAPRPDRIKTETDFRNIRESTDFTGLDKKYE